MQYKTIFLSIILLAVSLAALATEPPQYLRYKYKGSQTVCKIEGYIKNITFEYDSAGTCHVLFTHEETGGQRLYYTHNGSGDFRTPEPVFLMASGCQWMESAIGPDDAIHLVWLDESFAETYNPHFGAVFYIKIQNGTILMQETLHESEEGATRVNFDLDPAGNVHVVYELPEHPATGWQYQIAYIRIIDGVVETPLIRFLTPEYTAETYPVIYALDTDHVLIFGCFGQMYLLPFVSGEFRDLIQVTEKLVWSYHPYKVITDHENRLHIYYIQFGDYHQFPLYHTMSTDGGLTFSEPDLLVDTSEEFTLVSEPIILADNTPVVVTRSEVWNGKTFYPGYYYIDRGYGYSNPLAILPDLGLFPSWNKVEPVVRSHSDYLISPITAYIRKNDQNEYESELLIWDMKKFDTDEPIVVLDAMSSLRQLDFSDFYRVTIDFWNPLKTSQEANLVIALFLTLSDGMDDLLLYLGDHNGFPTLTPDYSEFRISIPPGWSCQNIAIYELDLSLINGIADWVVFNWYAAFFDPSTGQIVGYYSHDRTLIDYE